MTSRAKTFTLVLMVATTVFLGAAFMAWTVMPYTQMVTFFSKLKQYYGGNEQAFLTSHAAFYPHTFIQTEMRYQLVASLIKKYIASKAPENLQRLTVFAIDKFQESMALGDHVPQHYLVLGQAYDFLAALDTAKTAEYRTKAEASYAHALELFPRNQEVTYAYLINLSYQGRFNEAVTAAKQLLDDDPRIAESHYYYATLLYSKDNTAYVPEVLEHLEFAQDRIMDPLPRLTLAIYQRMLAYTYQHNDLDRLTTVVARLIKINPDQAEIYERILAYIAQYHRMPVLNLK